MAEDRHCCYWSSFGGGYRRPGSFIDFTKTLIDDTHHWYHLRGQKIRSARDLVQAIHIHDSLFVFEEGKAVSPLVSGKGSAEDQGSAPSLGSSVVQILLWPRITLR